ncbi:unnamed protein product, partial [Cyprideis torosa]
MSDKHIIGIDIGGTGTKAAIVNIETGELLTDRLKELTPKPSHPEAVAETVAVLIEKLGGPTEYMGVGFPAVIQGGKAQTAANIEKSWIGTDVQELICRHTGAEIIALNDADAAGMAEIAFGAGKGVEGTVLLIT